MSTTTIRNFVASYALLLLLVVVVLFGLISSTLASADKLIEGSKTITNSEWDKVTTLCFGLDVVGKPFNQTITFNISTSAKEEVEILFYEFSKFTEALIKDDISCQERTWMASYNFTIDGSEKYWEETVNFVGPNSRKTNIYYMVAATCGRNSTYEVSYSFHGNTKCSDFQAVTWAIIIGVVGGVLLLVGFIVVCCVVCCCCCDPSKKKNKKRKPYSRF